MSISDFMPPVNDLDVAAELDLLLPGWSEMAVGERREIDQRIIERGPTGWATWQPHLRAHNEPREIGGYSEDTAWSLSDYGLMCELEGRG